jgi:hypothetical protein
MANLHTEVERFRGWASAYPEDRRNGEWEMGYPEWPNLYVAFFDFLGRRPIDRWSVVETKDALYALARDNEVQYIAREIRNGHPELIAPLMRAAI